MTHIARKMTEILDQIPPVPAFVVRDPERSRAISPYAPVSANPVRLASQIIESVSKHGASAAAEIDSARATLLEGATEISSKLQELADAIRGKCDEAQQYMAAYCESANAVMTTVQELADRIKRQDTMER